MSSNKRLKGVDFARFCAFLGMVLVNFRIVLTPEANQSAFVNFFEGKAAALFVVLVGVGLGMFEGLGWLGALTENQSIVASLVFCALSIIFAALSMRMFKVGPLELLMRKIAG